MIHTINAKQAQDLIARGDLDVVDVREVAEWATGHIEGSRLVPLGTLRADVKGALPKDGILLICAAGVRSQTAARLAEGSGHKVVYNLSGGTRGWASAGLPLVHDQAEAKHVA